MLYAYAGNYRAIIVVDENRKGTKARKYEIEYENKRVIDHGEIKVIDV